MRLYRTTCALSSDDGLCVEMGVSGGGRVAVAVGQRPSVRLNRITRTSKEPPFRTTQTVMGLFLATPAVTPPKHSRYLPGWLK